MMNVLSMVAAKTKSLQEQATQLGGGGLDLSTVARWLLNVTLFVVGVVAVIMIIIGGIKMMTSQGDTGATAKARKTIIFGIIGLIIAVLAFMMIMVVPQVKDAAMMSKIKGALV